MIRKRISLAAVGLLLAVVTLTGCKQTEQYQDAPVGARNDGPADVYNMPDGFSNWAEKCDNHGFRVFVAFHNDGSYAAITALPDPTCPH